MARTARIGDNQIIDHSAWHTRTRSYQLVLQSSLFFYYFVQHIYGHTYIKDLLSLLLVYSHRLGEVYEGANQSRNNIYYNLIACKIQSACHQKCPWNWGIIATPRRDLHALSKYLSALDYVCVPWICSKPLHWTLTMGLIQSAISTITPITMLINAYYYYEIFTFMWRHQSHGLSMEGCRRTNTNIGCTYY